jgi:hypothetical protein
MEMPKLTDAHRKLQLLVGNWQGEEKMFPTPWDSKGGSAVGYMNNRLALDGFAVIQDYEHRREGVVKYWGHAIFTWDPNLQSYVLYWFDSLGVGQNVFQGSFDEKKLTLTYKSHQGYTRASWEFTSDKSFSYRMEVSGDGTQWQAMMEGTYSRIG